MIWSAQGPVTPLDRRLHDMRMRHFVGREPALDVLAGALRDRKDTHTVLHLHGPGGIGKSALLSRFADEAWRSGRTVHFVPAGAAVPAIRPEDAPLVLVDDLDRTPEPERWLRHTVLPELPPGAVVAVASRRPAGLGWRADPGWSEVLLTLPLAPLTPAESAAMLLRLGVPEAGRETAARVCAGHPLALRVASQILAAAPDGLAEPDLRREVALAISGELIGDLPSGAHRQALEVCALAPTTDEGLLRAVVPAADAGDLFTWLRGLPFVATTPQGLRPDAVARTVMEAELRWRDPEQFTALHERMTAHLRRRAQADTEVAPRAEPPRPVAWTRAEFDHEVRQALRWWRRPDLFADSPLRQSRMAADAGAADTVAGLRQAFTAALATLRSDPRLARYHRALATTFLDGAPTQEAAAARLHLAHSTYRRHLTRGLDELCAMLWKAEHHGLHLLSPAP